MVGCYSYCWREKAGSKCEFLENREKLVIKERDKGKRKVVREMVLENDVRKTETEEKA